MEEATDRTLILFAAVRSPRRQVPIRLACVVLSVATLAGYGQHALGGQDATLAEFDITFNQERVEPLVVAVMFAGQHYRFGIDTGATYTQFDRRLSGLLRRQTESSLICLHGGVENVDSYSSPPGMIGRFPLPPLVSVACQNLQGSSFSRSTKVDGILGLDALRDCVLLLDFDRGKVSFLRSTPQNAGVRVELANQHGLATVAGNVGACGRQDFVIDTGYNGEARLSCANFGSLLARRELSLAGTARLTSAAGSLRRRIGVLDCSLSVAGHNQERQRGRESQ